MNVDIAAYKVEFLSHYYEGRLRPIPAYAFGLMHRWARVASRAPWAANVLTQMPGPRGIAKAVLRVAPERRIPRFAGRTFRRWFERRDGARLTGPRVLLWPDTWNNYFLPGTARAAVPVLEAAGFHVTIPARPLCCGRPLYDYGMLDTAKRLPGDVLGSLRPHVRAGTSVVGLEPSCVSVFRDELLELFPHDDDAKRLAAQTVALGNVLARNAPAFAPPALRKKALVHGHCHDKAISASMMPARCSTKPGSTIPCSIPAAAAWLVRSATNEARTIACPLPVPNACCCPRCEMRAIRRSSSPTVSAAGSRSSRPHTVGRCTWRKS